jgi:hypothetical protein
VLLRITKAEKNRWQVEQTLSDPQEHNDWEVCFTLDLEKAREHRRPVLRWERLGNIQ